MSHKKYTYWEISVLFTGDYQSWLLYKYSGLVPRVQGLVEYTSKFMDVFEPALFFVVWPSAASVGTRLQTKELVHLAQLYK